MSQHSLIRYYRKTYQNNIRLKPGRPLLDRRIMQLIKSLGVAWQVARKDAMHAKCPILQTGKDVLHARRPILHDGMDSIVQWSPCRGLDGQHKNPGVDSQGYEYQHLYSDVDIAHVIFRYLKPSDEILLLRE